jgi:hypothetical protein
MRKGGQVGNIHTEVWSESVRNTGKLWEILEMKVEETEWESWEGIHLVHDRDLRDDSNIPVKRHSVARTLSVKKK